MPSYAPNDARTSTLLVRIPHISNCLLFRDSLSDPKALLALITGILQLGAPEILYAGYDRFYSLRKEVLAKKADAAIVRICVPGKELIKRDASRTVGLLIEQLQKPKTTISLASAVVSHEKKILAVAITVELGARRGHMGTAAAL